MLPSAANLRNFFEFTADVYLFFAKMDLKSLPNSHVVLLQTLRKHCTYQSKLTAQNSTPRASTIHMHFLTPGKEDYKTKYKTTTCKSITISDPVGLCPGGLQPSLPSRPARQLFLSSLLRSSSQILRLAARARVLHGLLLIPSLPRGVKVRGERLL